jgi:hypothetical protein
MMLDRLEVAGKNDQQMTAGAEHPTAVPQRGGNVPDVFENVEAEHRIKRIIRPRNGLSASDTKVGGDSTSGRELAGGFHHHIGYVDASDTRRLVAFRPGDRAPAGETSQVKCVSLYPWFD